MKNVDKEDEEEEKKAYLFHLDHTNYNGYPELGATENVVWNLNIDSKFEKPSYVT